MKLLIYIFCLIVFVQNLFGQEILLIRTDVDSNRRNFVTATYNFSLKVVVKNVKRCTGVSFVLRHNQNEYVRFSNYRALPFSKNGSVFVYPLYNSVDGFARVYAGILNGDTIGGLGVDNPEVIEFEFSVFPDAPSNDILEFVVEDAEAVFTDDSIGALKKLRSVVYRYRIHGFVNVWPGDTDNDGIVGVKDVSKIGLFLGYGSRKGNFRAFRRENASTFWMPQICLGWDSLEVTYADCDGDGEVTLNDMLVIPLNFGKTQSGLLLFNFDNKVEDKITIAELADNNIPLKLLANEEVVGFVCDLPCSSMMPGAKFTQNNFFSDKVFFYNNKTDSSLQLFVGSFSNNNSLNNTILYYSNREIVIWGKAITSYGKIVDACLAPVKSFSYLTESSIDSFDEAFNKIEFPNIFVFYNYLGKEIERLMVSNVTEIIGFYEKLPSGVYFIIILDQDKKGIINKPIKIIK
ncbi:MAG: hypothetical protein N2517_07490 [Ignavibacteria bacterium]|nr:hypothetical protein [Ignavibacteria bacterium]